MTPRPDMLLDLHPVAPSNPDQGPEHDEEPVDRALSEATSITKDADAPADPPGTDFETDAPNPYSHSPRPPREAWSLRVGQAASRLFSSRSASALPAADPPAAPRPADLWTRAPRPAAVRLRRTLAVGAALGASSILAGSLAWAFVVRPEIRAGAMAREEPQKLDERLARPPRSLSERPGRYDQLPRPRTWPAGQLGASSEAGPDARQSSTSVAPSPMAASTLHTTPRPGSRFQSEGAPPFRQYADRLPAGHNAEPTLEARARSSQLFFTGADEEPQVMRPVASPAPTTVNSAPPGQTAGSPPSRNIYNPARLTRPLSPYEIKAGSVIPAALLTSIDTSRRGPAAAVVTRNIHDTVSGRHLLVPQGSRLIGRYDGDSAYGDRKAFIVWERLILPDGRSLVLDEEPGVDATGALGVQGRIDRRLLPLALAVLAGGAVTAIGEAARNSDGGRGFLGDAGDAAALEAARTGSRLIDRELQVRPVIRLSHGSSVGVLVTRDLILEPWRQ